MSKFSSEIREPWENPRLYLLSVQSGLPRDLSASKAHVKTRLERAARSATLFFDWQYQQMPHGKEINN